MKTKEFSDESILICLDMTMIIWKHSQKNLHVKSACNKNDYQPTNWRSSLFHIPNLNVSEDC